MAEPFAWYRYQQGERVYYDSKKWDDCQPLYVHPKEWVDLAPAQIQDIYLKVLKEHRGAPQMQGQFAFAAALQNKIREENT